MARQASEENKEKMDKMIKSLMQVIVAMQDKPRSEQGGTYRCCS